jgi:hypothetical protein
MAENAVSFVGGPFDGKVFPDFASTFSGDDQIALPIILLVEEAAIDDASASLGPADENEHDEDSESFERAIEAYKRSRELIQAHMEPYNPVPTSLALYRRRARGSDVFDWERNLTRSEWQAGSDAKR